MLQVDVVRDPADLLPWRAAWRELFAARRHEASASYEWTEALFHNHIRAGDRLVLLVLSEGGTVRGIVPLVAETRRVLGVPLVGLAPLAERYNTHSDLLLASPGAECVLRLLEALFELPLAWDVFSMRRLLEESDVARQLIDGAGRLRAPVLAGVGEPSFVLTLPGTFTEYLGQRSAKFRNFLRRAEKRLGARGRVRFLRAGADLDPDAAYGALLDIEARSWKHGHGTAISAVGRQRGFYGELCRGLAADGHLHLTLLTLDDVPIAYNLGTVYGETYSYLKTSFVESERGGSPATVARARLVAALIAAGVRVFDFPGEPYEWETQWTREVRWHRTLTVFNRTLRGRCCALAQRLRERGAAARTGRRLAYRDPRHLKPGGKG